MGRSRWLRFFIPFALVGMVVGEIVWSSIFPGRIYHCPDGDFLGFVFPGDWIHGEVTVVDQVDGNFDMSYQDQLLRGWSPGKLWICWLAGFVLDVTIAAAAAWTVSRHWISPKTT